LETIRFNYINALKEAMYLRTNSSKEIMNMPKEEEAKLLESIQSSKCHVCLLYYSHPPSIVKFMDFWSINSKLIDVPREEIKYVERIIKVGKM
jgi:hypothetical protein